VQQVDPHHATHPIVAIDPRAIWLLAALAFVAVVVWILVTQALDTLLLLFVAITFGEGIRPLVDWLQKHHFPRPLAVLGIYLILVAAVLGLFALLLTPLTSQLVALLANLPTYMQRVQSAFQNLQQFASSAPEAQQALQAIPAQIGGLASTLLNTPLLVAGLAFKFIELYLMAFFWLTAALPLKSFVVATFPVDLRAEASDVIAELSHRLGGYVRATAINMGVIAVLSGGGLFILGIPYPLLLGFVAGMAEALPLIGPWLAGTFAVIVTLFTAGFVQAAEVAGLYLLIHLIEGNTLVPYVTYRMTELNPLVTIVAIAIGGAILGVVGAVLGVPVALLLQVLVLRVFVPGLRHMSGIATRRDIRHPEFYPR
jgi:predicted PurR-regulated permease PerM